MALTPIMTTPTSPSTPVYGATSIRSLTTTLTAQPSQSSITILYPWPAITQSLQYTTVSSSVFPVLVLTEVIGVVLSPTPIKTATLLQKSPLESEAQPPSLQQLNVDNFKVDVSPSCSDFKCWSRSQRVGTVLGIILVSLLIIAVMWWGLGRSSRSRSRSRSRGRRDEEGGRWRERRGALGSFLESFGCLSQREIRSPSRRGRRRRRRSRSSSLSSIRPYESPDMGRWSAYPPMALSTGTAPSRGWDSPTPVRPLPVMRGRERSRTPRPIVRFPSPVYYVRSRTPSPARIPSPRYFIRRRPHRHRSPTPPPPPPPPHIFFRRRRYRSPSPPPTPPPLYYRRRRPTPSPVVFPIPILKASPGQYSPPPNHRNRRQNARFAYNINIGSPQAPPPPIQNNIQNNVLNYQGAGAGNPGAPSPGERRSANNFVAANLVKNAAPPAAGHPNNVNKQPPLGKPNPLPGGGPAPFNLSPLPKIFNPPALAKAAIPKNAKPNAGPPVLQGKAQAKIQKNAPQGNQQGNQPPANLPQGNPDPGNPPPGNQLPGNQPQGNQPPGNQPQAGGQGNAQAQP